MAVQNYVHLSGRIIPNTEKSPKNFVFYPGNDKKKSMLSLKVSVQRPFAAKDEKTGYYPSDIFPCKIFGSHADFHDKYTQPGDIVEIEGIAAYTEAYEKEDGTVCYPQFYVNVSQMISHTKRDNKPESAEKDNNKDKKVAPAPRQFEMPF